MHSNNYLRYIKFIFIFIYDYGTYFENENLHKSWSNIKCYLHNMIDHYNYQMSIYTINCSLSHIQWLISNIFNIYIYACIRSLGM